MLNQDIKVKVLNYTEYPEVRYIGQDKFSGEGFYYEVIKPSFEKALKSECKLIVDLDDTAGYGFSFIDEAFGNLVYDFDYSKIQEILHIISDIEPDWIDIIKNDILVKWKEKKDKKFPRKELD